MSASDVAPSCWHGCLSLGLIFYAQHLCNFAKITPRVRHQRYIPQVGLFVKALQKRTPTASLIMSDTICIIACEFGLHKPTAAQYVVSWYYTILSFFPSGFSTPNLALMGKRASIQEPPKMSKFSKIVLFGLRKPTQ